jgi:hypothetical protein
MSGFKRGVPTVAEQIVSPPTDGDRRPDELRPADGQVDLAVLGDASEMRYVEFDRGQVLRLSILTDGNLGHVGRSGVTSA